MKNKIVVILMLLFVTKTALAQQHKCFVDKSGDKWCGNITKVEEKPTTVIIKERDNYDKAVGTVFVGALTAAIVYTAIKDRGHYRPSYHTTHVVHEYDRPRWHHRRPRHRHSWNHRRPCSRRRCR